MKKIITSLYLVSCCGLFGCGSVDGSLTTSTVSAVVDTLVLDSDVAAWVDSTGAKATACATTSTIAIPAADSVNVTVSSTPYSNTGSMGVPVRVESATISYTPANSITPAMASEYQTVGARLANGGSVTIPIRVATTEQKISLLPILATCTGSVIYNYYTKVTFNLTEEGTGKKSTVDVSLQLRFSDWIDK